MMKRNYIVRILSLLCLLTVRAAVANPDLPENDTITRWSLGNFPKQAQQTFEQLSVSGYYRFVTNYRHFAKDQNGNVLAYPHLQNTPNNIFVGDDSQIPQLSMNISGSLGKRTSFGTDLFMWTPMTGQGEIENVKGLNLGISLYGSYSSDIGDFNVRTGGINWYALTPFTFQTNKGYDRYSIFERNPWDPNTRFIDSRYATFYNVGAINQDERWGQQAFQGIILEGNRLPNDFSGVIMYGKTQLNGGLSPVPNTSFGGKIKKSFQQDYISLNTFNNTSYSDSTERYRAGFNVATVEFKTDIGEVTLKGEVGVGRTFDFNRFNDWGELVSLKASTRIADRVPTELHVFRLSPDAVNNSAAFINTARDLTNYDTYSPGTQPVLPAVASAMVSNGQLVNNRTGFELNTQVDVGPFKTSIGYHLSTELENLSPAITYSHPVNSLVLAHFWRWAFPNDVGPYGNLSKIYRSVYETLNITAVDSISRLPKSRKSFNSLELNMKYNTRLLDRELYVFYLGQYSSSQFFVSPFTVLSEKALLRTYYHQLESYWTISKSVVWCNYIGYERIIANYDTETDVVTGRPKNQTGWSIATGFDIKMSRNAGLYLRQRWMDYKDSSFRNDRYKGYESTLEIKIFF
ncbi:MAG: hypothetical protein RIQ47_51 [Bacteroidota bacterium]|jgi:hypothetical protein